MLKILTRGANARRNYGLNFNNERYVVHSKTGEPLHHVNIYSYDGHLVKSIVSDGSATMKLNL